MMERRNPLWLVSSALLRHQLPFLLTLFSAQSCDVVSGLDCPSFAYMLYDEAAKKTRSHRYYPDFFHMPTKTVWEVKSAWTFFLARKANLAKRLAVLAAGYNFVLWMRDTEQCARINEVIRQDPHGVNLQLWRQFKYAQYELDRLLSATTATEGH
jgi:hypothetical protein